MERSSLSTSSNSSRSLTSLSRSLAVLRRRPIRVVGAELAADIGGTCGIGEVRNGAK